MLVIRMRRMGAKKNPHFRVVVTQQRAPRESDFVESLGTYDPQTSPEKLTIDRERYAYWVKVGAQPSDTVRTVVARHKNDVVAAIAVPAAAAPPTSAPAVFEPAATEPATS